MLTFRNYYCSQTKLREDNPPGDLHRGVCIQWVCFWGSVSGGFVRQTCPGLPLEGLPTGGPASGVCLWRVCPYGGGLPLESSFGRGLSTEEVYLWGVCLQGSAYKGSAYGDLLRGGLPTGGSAYRGLSTGVCLLGVCLWGFCLWGSAYRGLPTGGSAYEGSADRGVCLQGGLPTGGLPTGGSAYRGLPTGESAYGGLPTGDLHRGICLQEICLGGSA